MISLHPHQTEMVENARSLIGRGVKSILLQAATGFGKSVVGAYMIQGGLAKNNTSWFVVPRRELTRQMIDTMNDFHIPHSFISAGYEYNKYTPVHLCTVGSLVGRLGLVTPPKIAFIDECHYGQGALDEIIAWLKSHGTIIIGLSATPMKMNGRGLGCWFDEMVQGPSIRWLIDNKYLSEYRLFSPDKPDLSMLDIVAGDYAKGQLAEKMEQDRVLIGNAVKHYKQNAMNKLNVTFTVSRKHAEITAESFRNAGIPSMYIGGDTKEDERKRIIRAFARREIFNLCSVDLLSMGFDLASNSGMDVTVESMSDLAPTRSLPKQMQKWGRVLRKKDYPAIINDHANNIGEHGYPCDERNWTLADQEKKKRGSSERIIQTSTCEKCFFTFRAALVCPNCGHERPIQYREIEEVEGELSEVDVRVEKKEKRMEVGRARTMADLVKIQQERGYDRGWIFMQAKLKGIKK